ncbi:unnamed protein product [Camellia sinensis]
MANRGMKRVSFTFKMFQILDFFSLDFTLLHDNISCTYCKLHACFYSLQLLSHKLFLLVSNEFPAYPKRENMKKVVVPIMYFLLEFSNKASSFITQFRLVIPFMPNMGCTMVSF